MTETFRPTLSDSDSNGLIMLFHALKDEGTFLAEQFDPITRNEILNAMERIEIAYDLRRAKKIVMEKFNK